MKQTAELCSSALPVDWWWWSGRTWGDEGFVFFPTRGRSSRIIIRGMLCVRG